MIQSGINENLSCMKMTSKTKDKAVSGQYTPEHPMFRGQNGWDTSLRQAPPRISLFSSPMPKNKERKKTTDIASNKRKSSLRQDDVIPLKSQKIELKKIFHQAKEFCQDLGKIVWGKFSSQVTWPGIIISGDMCACEPARPDQHWIFWLGDHRISQLKVTNVWPFTGSFKDCYKKKDGKLYNRAVEEALKECMGRVTNKGTTECLTSLIDWANQGFPNNKNKDASLPRKGHALPAYVSDKLKDIVEITEQLQSERDISSDTNMKIVTKRGHKVRETPTQDKFDLVRRRIVKIEDVCIACNEPNSVINQHPLFQGGICKQCKPSILKAPFLIGEDGGYVMCFICGNGGEIVVCDKDACSKVFCSGCIVTLIGDSHWQAIKKMNKWHCFLCSTGPATNRQGLLKSKSSWCTNLQKLFIQGLFLHQITPKYLNKKRLQVLAIHDHAGIGLKVLHRLGMEVGSYYTASSAIPPDAGATTIHDLGSHLMLQGKQLAAMSPIDIILCLPFSVGLPSDYKHNKSSATGVGPVFYQFYKILSLLHFVNRAKSTGPPFWFMMTHTDVTEGSQNEMSRFLACYPVIDGISSAKQEQGQYYYWGNIPDMYRFERTSPLLKQWHLDHKPMEDRLHEMLKPLKVFFCNSA